MKMSKKIKLGDKVYHIQYGEGEVTKKEKDLLWIWFWRIPNFINDGVIPIEYKQVKESVPKNWDECGIDERENITKVVFLEKFNLKFEV